MSSNDRLYRNDLIVAPTARGHCASPTSRPPAASTRVATAWASRPAISTTTGGSISYLTKFDAPNQLLRNNGDGTFTDVSKASGTDQHSWSVSAAFVDIDRDGWLDLFVGNYLRYRLEGNTQVLEPDRRARLLHARQLSRRCPIACIAIAGTARLPMSRRAAHVAGEFGPALGVSTADFNGDGWMDIYVANDGKENQLWLNRRDGTFENGALLAGVALPQSGKAEGSMGVDAGDFDNDGDEDLVMTELTAEGSNLFVNDGTGIFTDASARVGDRSGQPAVHRIRRGVARLRQRRPARSRWR